MERDLPEDCINSTLDYSPESIAQERLQVRDSYKKIFDGVSVYPDNEEGLRRLFENHTDIDIVFVTSANYNHSRHLKAVLDYSSCKNIYTEKPLFTNFEEFTGFNLGDDAHIFVGLTLRYSSMAKIVVQRLRQYQEQLGVLKQVKAWERVKFSQALTAFMMSWRRYISLSGGFLLEKSIHDLDLALFFMHSLNVDPQEISVTTKSSHGFFKQSNKKNILNEILSNDVLKSTLVSCELSPFQPLTPFSLDKNGNINWSATLNDIFKELPLDDNFDKSDIIPDYHMLNATIKTAEGSSIDFELEVALGGFRPKTERGMKFIFENGHVAVDVIQSSMTIELNNGTRHEFDLKTNNSAHADGDFYIARSLLGTLPKGQYIATFNDSIVQLATIVGLVSEQQALLKDEKVSQIKKTNNGWTVA